MNDGSFFTPSSLLKGKFPDLSDDFNKNPMTKIKNLKLEFASKSNPY